MLRPRLRPRLPLLLAAAALALSSGAAARPRLGVLVVFDQLRSADVDRLEPAFGPGGFGGLMKKGAARFDARYPYAVCETSPGHATLATGAGPQVHGITVNNWWQDGRLVYSVFDPKHRVLGAEDGRDGRGPAQLRVGTLGDTMKVESGGVAKVITVSLKDRAAVLTAGHAADLALWYDPDQGRFTTSTAYKDALPSWVEKLRPRVEQSLKEGTWSPLPVPAGNEPLFLADEQLGENEVLGGRTFPHDLAAVADESRRRSWYRGTPQAIDDVFAHALAAVEAEGLGQDIVPDLLVVGVSATDFTGHWFGPLSLEMTDLLRRADQSLRRFVSALEARFGQDGFVLAVTADHGSTPLSQRAVDAGAVAGRIEVKALLRTVDEAIARAIGGPVKKRTPALLPPHLWLALDDLSPADREKAIAAARKALLAEPGIAATYRVDEPDPPGDPYAEKVRLSTYPGRTGTILVRQHPRFLFDFTDDFEGTDHGAPYSYDARVPLYVLGPGVRRGRFAREVDPRDVAPTLAFLLSVPPPDAAQGKPVPAVGQR